MTLTIPTRGDLPGGRDSRLPTAASLWLALAVAGFGLVPLFARHLLDAGLSPEAIALYRFGLVLLITAPLLPRVVGTPQKRRPALLLAGAGSAMGLAWSSYLYGLDIVSIAWAGTIYMTYPLFVLVLAWAWLRQPFERRAIFAGGLVLAAAVTLLIGAKSDLEQLGPALLLCLPAPLAFAFLIVVLVRKADALGTLEKLAVGLLGTVAGLLPLVLRGDPASLVPAAATDWFWIAGMALFTAALPQLIYTAMAPRLPEAQVAMLGALELPVMVAIGWLALEESLGLPDALAILLVIAAVAVAPQPASPRRDPDKAEGT
ncbi:DMT family transporter [Algihabitans albus]|uniref:DMT family transporter n=1 Tax=Algihabitans albus TaxID=2164067 RepID=UPI000E5C93B8|nr:DMT family transporter [Algihabitans albus]